MPNVVTRKAWGKINLALAVGPPEAGGLRKGWHRIASWMHSIDLFDTIEVERLPAGASTLVTHWADDAPQPSPIDWPPEADLVSRAHRALELHVGQPLPARIRITKRIPVGSGLGGGSSDAAGTLLALRDLFDLGLPDHALRDIGASLGSDVPFFIDDRVPPRPALVLAFGEAIKRVTPSRADLALILPPFGCGTAAVYQAFDGTLRADHSRRDDLVEAACGPTPDPDRLFNDLAPAAEAVYPDLARLRRRAAEVFGRPVHLSGSGSTLFVIHDAALPLPKVDDAVVIRSKLV